MIAGGTRMTSTLHGRRRLIREFISTVLEAHQEPDAVRPRLGDLAACLSEDVPTWLPQDEELFVEPEPYRPHPAGHLRRHNGLGIWAQVAGTTCYLCFPAEMDVRYRFEVAGSFAAMVLQRASRDFLLSENFTEVPIDRVIIDPSVVVILSDCRRHDDIELIVQ
jgi:hypothetical protein